MKPVPVWLLSVLLLLMLPGSGVLAQTYQTMQADLESLIRDAAAQGIRMSVAVMDLADGTGDQVLSAGSDAPYQPASTIKMLLIAALMQQVDAGNLQLDATVPVNASDIVGGMGRLQNETVPQQVTLRRLAELTVTISDNTATNVLVDAVGYPAMAALAQQLGLSQTQFGRKMFEPAQPPERDNSFSARDALELLVQVYRGSFLSAASRDQILAWLSAQTVKTKIGAGVPDGAPLAHKTGENGPVSHDMGYILTPGSEVALAIFTESSTTTDFDTAQAQLNPWVAQAAGMISHATQH